MSSPPQDFYNLVDVYLDAVFHPRCVSDRRVFEQEGWHYELDNKEVGGGGGGRVRGGVLTVNQSRKEIVEIVARGGRVGGGERGRGWGHGMGRKGAGGGL